VEQGDSVEWRGDTEQTFDNAEQAYRKALALAPDNPRIEAQLAAMLARRNVQFPASGRMEEIRRLTADAVRRDPEDPMPWVAQAKLLLLEDKPKEAEEAARKAIDRDPDFDRGYTQLGEALIKQGRKDAGFAELRRAADMKQGYIRARLTLAAKLQNAGRYEEAATEFLKVLDYDRDHPTAKENLADIYFSTGRYSDAIPLLRDVFENTHDFRSANSLGNNYFQLGRIEEAIEAYKNAYAINPFPVVARNLGEAYEKVGRKEEARRWYEHAIPGFDRQILLGGERAELLSGRAYCVAKLGRYDEALQNIEEAMRLKPNQNTFVFRVAQIYAMAGRREEVYAWTRRAVEAGYSREDVRRDTTFRDFQNDPRFQEILESNKH
ncbi:MAG TPA: tetratricopeptide repeat protein, partial [Thermoanaerobaculia bacterium]|nr:tetratricopeptide repeat protein [Thermoanaerobaculia bacterium]